MNKPAEFTDEQWEHFQKRTLPNHQLLGTPFVYQGIDPSEPKGFQYWTVACDGWILVAQRVRPSEERPVHTMDELRAIFSAGGKVMPSMERDGDAIEIGLSALLEWCRIGIEACPKCGGEGFCYDRGSDVRGAIDHHIGVILGYALDRRALEWALLPFLSRSFESRVEVSIRGDMLHLKDEDAEWRAVVPLVRGVTADQIAHATHFTFEESNDAG